VALLGQPACPEEVLILPFCGECGSSAAPGEKFCSQCGNAVAEPAPSPSSASKIFVADERRTCPACRLTQEHPYPYCNNCGTALEAPPRDISPPPAIAPRVCPSCGLEQSHSDPFCENCGSAVSGPRVSGAAPPSRCPLCRAFKDPASGRCRHCEAGTAHREPASRKLLWLALALFMVVCAAGLTGWWFLTYKQPAATRSQSQPRSDESGQSEQTKALPLIDLETQNAGLSVEEYPAPLVRERQIVAIEAVTETWELRWKASPTPTCAASDNTWSARTCYGLAYGESGDLILVRIRKGEEIDRLEFSGALQRWEPNFETDFEASKKDGLRDVVARRPVVKIMDFIDYDHYGNRSEFYLQTSAPDSGGEEGMVVGVSRSDQKLHIFGTVSKPTQPLLLKKSIWAALGRASGSVEVVEQGCGDHGSEVETTVRIGSTSGRIDGVRREFACPRYPKQRPISEESLFQIDRSEREHASPSPSTANQASGSLVKSLSVSRLAGSALIGDVSFRFPGDWQISKAKTMTIVAPPGDETPLSDGTKRRNRGIKLLIIASPQNGMTESPVAVLDGVFGQATESNRSMKRLGHDILMPIDHHPAAMLEYRDSSAEREIDEFGVMLVVQENTEIVYLRMFCPAAERDSGMQLFKSISNSVHVN
jgi:Double zinc ribbon